MMNHLRSNACSSALSAHVTLLSGMACLKRQSGKCVGGLLRVRTSLLMGADSSRKFSGAFVRT